MDQFQTFTVLKIDPTVKTFIKHVPIYEGNTAAIVGYDKKEVPYVYGVATDGSRFQGEYIEYSFSMTPGLMVVGDKFVGTVESDSVNNVRILDILTGKNRTIVSPAPPALKAAPEPQPESVKPENQTPTWMGSAMNGSPLSGSDLVAFAGDYLSLRTSFRKLAEAFKKHTEVCKCCE